MRLRITGPGSLYLMAVIVCVMDCMSLHVHNLSSNAIAKVCPVRYAQKATIYIYFQRFLLRIKLFELKLSYFHIRFVCTDTL